MVKYNNIYFVFISKNYKLTNKYNDTIMIIIMIIIIIIKTLEIPKGKIMQIRQMLMQASHSK